jgi:predicted metal-dependent phosphoesterase TrpH/glycosyltransferase involved in cell wall biosynthesis
VGLRICLVTPFAWSQPHEVNDHVAGAAGALRRLGHDVTVLTPSTRAADLLAGRRALARGERRDVIAVGPAFPISRRSQMGVPMGIRANLLGALRQGDYDIVHGFEPGLPSLSYVALQAAETFTAATFLSPDRLDYPARRSRRDRLRARVDALLATSEDTAAAAAERFPGDFRIVPAGIDVDRFTPAQKQNVIAVQLETSGRAIVRAAIRALDELPGWELVALHTKPLSFRPTVPNRLRGRVHVRAARREDVRARVLAEAAIFVPAAGGHARLRLEAAAAGCAIAEPPEAERQPELVSAAVARLGSDDSHRRREALRSRKQAEAQSVDGLARVLDGVYGELTRKRRARRDGDPLVHREWIAVDLHMHTSWSHDCSIDVEELVAHAEHIGLGGIAVTDHNAFGGAREAVDLARHRDLVVIPGEEVKTDDQGEVIGLFLEEEISRGMSFADTISAIRGQGGVVYLPHPFDRMHAIPDPATLHRHIADIDVLEVYNARLLRESFNHEALRFARKYRLLQGAGSDAHVLQGVGTGALRMRRFEGAEEFLLSLRTAEVLRRPKSLAYLQSLKWVAQVKDVTSSRPRRTLEGSSSTRSRKR